MFHREAIMCPFCLSIKYTISISGKVNFVWKAMLWSIKLEVVSPIPRWVSPYLVLDQQILCLWKVRGLVGANWPREKLERGSFPSAFARFAWFLARVSPAEPRVDWLKRDCSQSMLQFSSTKIFWTPGKLNESSYFTSTRFIHFQCNKWQNKWFDEHISFTKWAQTLYVF